MPATRVMALRELVEGGDLIHLQVQQKDSHGEWEEVLTASTLFAPGDKGMRVWTELGAHESSETVLIAERSE